MAKNRWVFWFGVENERLPREMRIGRTKWRSLSGLFWVLPQKGSLRGALFLTDLPILFRAEEVTSRSTQNLLLIKHSDGYN